MTNQTPQSTFDEKLEAIFERMADNIGESKGERRDDTSMIFEETKAAITSLVLEEVIGENDVRRNPSGRTHQRTVNNRNQLRAEQRSIITKESL